MTFRALANTYLGTQAVRNHPTYPWKKASIEKRFFQNFGNYRLITSLHFLLNNGGKKEWTILGAEGRH